MKANVHAMSDIEMVTLFPLIFLILSLSILFGICFIDDNMMGKDIIVNAVIVANEKRVHIPAVLWSPRKDSFFLQIRRGPPIEDLWEMHVDQHVYKSCSVGGRFIIHYRVGGLTGMHYLKSFIGKDCIHSRWEKVLQSSKSLQK